MAMMIACRLMGRLLLVTTLLCTSAVAAIGAQSEAAKLPEKETIQLPEIKTPPIGPDAVTYYVNSATGNDAKDGRSESSAFKTIHRATSNKAFKGGDVIVVMPGRYEESVVLGKSGRASGYTTLMAMPGQARPSIVSNPTIYSAGWGVPQNGDAISIRANYVRVSGFDVTWQYDAKTPGIYGSAIGVCCSNQKLNGANGPVVHHVFIDRNVAHDSPSGGISANFSDYVTIFGNVVYGNSNQAPNQTSGISIYAARDLDHLPGFHTIIASNVSYNNRNLVRPNYTVPNGTVVTGNCATDGNGIIIDSNRGQQTNGVAYEGATLIFGNLTYDNGGRGVHIYQSDNITVVNNTTYHNVSDPLLCEPAQQGEISVIDADNVSVLNNIAESAGVAHALVDENTKDSVWKDNLSFGSANSFGHSTRLVFDQSNLVGVDPMFVAPSINPSEANFSLRPGSRAIGVGAAFSTRQTDIVGDSSPANSPTNLGAYFK